MKHQLRLFGFNFIGVLLLFSLGACVSSTSYTDVSSAEAKKMIDNGEVIVLDVRTEAEYAAGHIPGALLIPVQELASRVDELDREQSYLIVCRSGNRSVQASKVLLNDGFNSIYNLDIGMNGWTDEVDID